jgi:hypothetical protein
MKGADSAVASKQQGPDDEMQTPEHIGAQSHKFSESSFADVLRDGPEQNTKRVSDAAESAADADSIPPGPHGIEAADAAEVAESAQACHGHAPSSAVNAGCGGQDGSEAAVEIGLQDAPPGARADIGTMSAEESAETAKTATENAPQNASAEVVGVALHTDTLGTGTAEVGAAAADADGANRDGTAPFEGAAKAADMPQAALEPSLAHHFQDSAPGNAPGAEETVCVVSVETAPPNASYAPFALELSPSVTVAQLARVIAQRWNVPEGSLGLSLGVRRLQALNETLAGLGAAADAALRVEVAIAEGCEKGAASPDVFAGLCPTRVITVQVRRLT